MTASCLCLSWPGVCPMFGWGMFLHMIVNMCVYVFVCVCVYKYDFDGRKQERQRLAGAYMSPMFEWGMFLHMYVNIRWRKSGSIASCLGGVGYYICMLI